MSSRPDRPSIHIYFSPLRGVSRVLREARALQESGLTAKTKVIGYLAPGLPATEFVGAEIEFRRLAAPFTTRRAWGSMRVVSFGWWTVGATFSALRESPSLVVAHSLAALPVAVVVAKLARAPLVYDAHELETARNGWPTWLSKVARKIEGSLVGSAAEVLVVSEPIADWYRATYQLDNVSVILNVPDTSHSRRHHRGGLRERLGLDEHVFMLLYHGRIAPGRGLDALVAAMAGLPNDLHLVLMGDGLLAHDFDARLPASKNIHRIPAVDPDELIDTASDADVGLCLIEDVCLSYQYCMPNKLFEYLHANLHLIVSDLPEMAKIVARNGLGEIVAIDPPAIRDAILRVRHRPRREPDASLLERYSWATESRRFVEVVARHMPARTEHS